MWGENTPVVEGPSFVFDMQNFEVSEEEDEENEMFTQFQSSAIWNLFPEGTIVWYPKEMFAWPVLKLVPLRDFSPLAKLPWKCYEQERGMTLGEHNT